MPYKLKSGLIFSKIFDIISFVEVKLSRHSKNNIRLYEITQIEIEQCIHNSDKQDNEGRY
ncbi:MAG: hypothetical protein COS68_05995 [Elusimicrobia bacterium CG06_land_8_20_14_3_00_38_11]|nr:MAG: hypothetical protein COS68_05995 [Elusimicrobia bacterium CG06_land_8_20_14_3_00_38_11]